MPKPKVISIADILFDDMEEEEIAAEKAAKAKAAEAYEGDYPDPTKNKEVDWSYDPGYLRRRSTFSKAMKERMRRKRQKAR